MKRVDWKQLRYTISGYNISNTIGYVCNYDYPPEATRKLVQQALKANARLPYWVGFDAYVEERQKAMGEEYCPLEDSRRIMEEEYFSACWKKPFPIRLLKRFQHVWRKSA